MPNHWIFRVAFGTRGHRGRRADLRWIVSVCTTLLIAADERINLLAWSRVCGVVSRNIAGKCAIFFSIQPTLRQARKRAAPRDGRPLARLGAWLLLSTAEIFFGENRETVHKDSEPSFQAAGRLETATRELVNDYCFSGGLLPPPPWPPPPPLASLVGLRSGTLTLSFFSSLISPFLVAFGFGLCQSRRMLKTEKLLSNSATFFPGRAAG